MMNRSTLCICLGALTILLPNRGGAYMPDRAWGTYLGYESNFRAGSVAVAPNGDVVVCGSTYGNDAFVVRLTAEGQYVWSKNIGGPGTDQCHDVAVDSVGNVVAVGQTQSVAGISTPDGLQPVLSADFDGFAMMFDADGNHVWGTYLGGAGADSVHSVAFDAEDSLVLAGWGGALPFALPGAHDADFNGVTDIFLLKFAADHSLEWGTYYGGPNQEEYPGVAVGDDVVYLVGDTGSATGVATPGAHDTTKNAVDAFVARFDGDGVRQWGSYFGGEGAEACSSVAVTPGGGVALFGMTNSDTDIATPDSYQPDRGPSTKDLHDGMIASFDGTGALQWATYLGVPYYHETIGGGTVDPAGNLLFVGTTKEQSIFATPDAFQPKGTMANDWDLFIVKFDPAGQRRWGTFLGSYNTEAVSFAAGSRPLATAGLDAVYVTGIGGEAGAIGTQGTFMPNPGGNTFLVRLTQGQGDACADDSECEAGLCVDGVCCDGACEGECVACSVAAGAAVDGTCAPISDDTPCMVGSCMDGVCERPGEETTDGPMTTTGEPMGTTSGAESTGASGTTETSAEPGSDSATSDEPATSAPATTTADTPTSGADSGEASTSSAAGTTGASPEDGAPADGCACTVESPGSRDILLAALALVVVPRRRRTA